MQPRVGVSFTCLVFSVLGNSAMLAICCLKLALSVIHRGRHPMVVVRQDISKQADSHSASGVLQNTLEGRRASTI